MHKHMYKHFFTIMFCVAVARFGSRLIMHSGLIY
jgi:hypothetical protein